jgi:hypothetical protein
MFGTFGTTKWYKSLKPSWFLVSRGRELTHGQTGHVTWQTRRLFTVGGFSILFIWNIYVAVNIFTVIFIWTASRDENRLKIGIGEQICQQEQNFTSLSLKV